VLAEAGHTLLSAKQYVAAREVLGQAASADTSGAIQLDLARALFGEGDAAQALQKMEQIPPSQRGGEYHLAHSRMLIASGKSAEGVVALEQALQTAPLRPEFYQQAVAFLVKQDQSKIALRFLDQGARLLAGSREILLLKAVALELAGQGD